MKYYAYINEKNIATLLYKMPQAVVMTEEQGFIELSEAVYNASEAGTEGSIMGMRWNKEKRVWEEVAQYYYAVLIEQSFRKDVTNEDEKRYFVKEIVESTEEVKDLLYIPLMRKEDAQVGQLYNPETDGFTTPEFTQVAFTDTDQISVNGKNVVLTDKLTQMEEAVANIHIPEVTAESIAAKLKTVDGSGSGLDADLLDGKEASCFATKEEVTAESIAAKVKTVDGSGSGLDADLLDGKDSTYFATAAGLQNLSTTVSGKAASNHTHDFSNVYAAKVHGHSEYAPVNHTHPSSSNIVVATTGQANIAMDTSFAAEHSQINGIWINSQLGGWRTENNYLIVPKAGNYLIELEGYAKVAMGNIGSSSNLVWVNGEIINGAGAAIVSARAVVRQGHCNNLDNVAMCDNDSKKVMYLNAGDQLIFKAREQCKSASTQFSFLMDIDMVLKITEV